MRVKICGITKPEQGKAIAQLGATALGFICVPGGPRYVTPTQISTVVERLSSKVDCIGVFANASYAEIVQTVTLGRLTGVQLHGDETPEFCQKLAQILSNVEIIKALKIKTASDLSQADIFTPWVNTLLLDAHHPQMLGGTGQTLDWTTLGHFHPRLPWFLAGGLNPDNIMTALKQVTPSGIDLSSGVENAPGDKDLNKVAQLFENLKKI